jgi:hypothetical protein
MNLVALVDEPQTSIPGQVHRMLCWRTLQRMHLRNVVLEKNSVLDVPGRLLNPALGVMVRDRPMMAMIHDYISSFSWWLIVD